MKITRTFATLAAAALLLSGCGTTEQASTPSGSSTAASTEKITLTDSRGKEVVLDGPALRVAGTEWNAVENLVSLGVQPVGVADIKGYDTWVSAAKLDGSTKDIGTRGEPSIDTLASLDLDLVIVTDQLVDGALEQIEKTTPVIVVPGGDAKDNIGQMFKNLDLIAKATGKEAKAADLKSGFERKLEEGKKAIAASATTDKKFVFSDSWVDAGSVSVRPFANGSLVSDVIEKLGMENAWTAEGDAAYGLDQTDVEGLTAVGDTHFWYIANDAFGDPYVDELKDNAIWKSLPFVKNGKVDRFPDAIWMFGGPASMEQVIDAAVASAS